LNKLVNAASNYHPPTNSNTARMYGELASKQTKTRRGVTIFIKHHIVFQPTSFATKLARAASSLRPTNLSITLPFFMAITVGTASTYKHQNKTGNF